MSYIYNANGFIHEENNLRYEDFTLCYGPVHKDEITEAYFHKDTKSIAEAAFERCCNLEVVGSGDHICTMHQKAFMDCESLKLVNLNVEVIGPRAFENSGYGDGIKFRLAYTRKIYTNAFKNTKIKELRLPKTVEFIYPFAFQDATFDDTRFFIPPKVLKIGEDAFKNTNLTDIYLPDSCIDVGNLFDKQYNFKIHMSKELFDKLGLIANENIVIDKDPISLESLLDRYTFKQLNDKRLKEEKIIETDKENDAAKML